MLPASLILGLTLLGFAAWLEWREQQESDPGPLFDAEYLSRRRRGRRAVHILLAASGLLILAAAVAGRGVLWAALWSAVCGLLILVLVIAIVDFWRTHRYFYRKLPELRQQMLHPDETGEDEPNKRDASPETSP